jgi:hypothetical protein
MSGETEPDELALREDLEGTAFKVGARRKKWRLVRLEFPIAYFAIAAPPRPNSPDWLLLKADCRGYRASAPTAQLWNGKLDAALPVGERPRDANGNVLIAFSPWKACLYHPVDRMARSHWSNAHADLAWGPGRDIVFFLETVYGLLHVSEYAGASAPADAVELPPPPVAPDSERAA